MISKLFFVIQVLYTTIIENKITILGPLLFVLFINDLPKDLSQDTSIALYADDTKIWRTIFSDDDIVCLQNDINTLNLWAHSNLMKFHPDKCKVLTVHHTRNVYFGDEKKSCIFTLFSR